MIFTLNYSQFTNFPEIGEAVETAAFKKFYIDRNGETIQTPYGYYVTPTGDYVKLERVTYHYDIEVTKDRITVNGKTMPVKYDWDYAYKLQKTQIKSDDLPGFFTHYGENKDGGDLSSSFNKLVYALICAHVVKYGKCTTD